MKQCNHNWFPNPHKEESNPETAVGVLNGTRVCANHRRRKMWGVFLEGDVDDAGTPRLGIEDWYERANGS